MGLMKRVLPAIHNGVSRQPAILRSPDQTEEELNTWGMLSQGVGKRPPTEHLAHIGLYSDDVFIHHINRDVTERYIIVIDGGAIFAFDGVTGEHIPVNCPGGTQYLVDGKFKAVTVADYTFIVNTLRTVNLSVFTDASSVDQDYHIWVNRAPPAGFAGDASNTIWAGQPLQYPSNPSGMNWIGSVPSIEKLPETAVQGDMYEVSGSIGGSMTSFYVYRNGAVWDETVRLGLQNHLDPLTMPHALVREADGTFTFAPFSWAPRRVGDITSNPPPTFVGRTIRDVFFYQNRLGFLCDENAIFSCAGDFGNYWRNTVLDYVASDVVDVAVATTNVALLNHALPFNDGIMAFADQTQFSITNGEDGLTPSSVAITPVTRYEVNTKVAPVAIGSEVYFCGNQNGSSVIWEYTRLQDNDAMSAAEITAHVPDYLPSNLTQLVAATNQKALFSLTGTPEVYAYQFYWNGNEKLISAHRKWTFGGDVVSGEYLDGWLYLLVRYPIDGNIKLERMNLEESAHPAEQTYQVHLDRRLPVAGVSVGGKTEFSLPYSPEDRSKFRIVNGKDHPTKPGALLDPTSYTWVNAYKVSVPGNETGGNATVGCAYTQRLQFSRQFAQDYQGRALSTGRLQLRTFTVNYVSTGYFRTEVAPYGAALPAESVEVLPSKLADFTGKVVGAYDLVLNKPVLHTGAYSFQIYGDAAQATIALVNETHAPATFASAEWEGFYQNRAM